MTEKVEVSGQSDEVNRTDQTAGGIRYDIRPDGIVVMRAESDLSSHPALGSARFRDDAAEQAMRKNRLAAAARLAEDDNRPGYY